MTTKEVLIAARAKIATSKSWTRGELARNDKSRPVPCSSNEACRWCAEGAVRSVAPVGEAYKIILLLASDSLWKFNDTHTHAEVLALFDKAIESAA